MNIIAYHRDPETFKVERLPDEQWDTIRQGIDRDFWAWLSDHGTWITDGPKPAYMDERDSYLRPSDFGLTKAWTVNHCREKGIEPDRYLKILDLMAADPTVWLYGSF